MNKVTQHDKYLQYGKYTQKPPKWLMDNVNKIDKSAIDEEYVKKVIRVIADEFDPAKHEITKTNNIRESRLINVNDILRRRLSSCGTKTTVVTSVFRNLGIPTKLIHCRYVEVNPNMRHAWNEILLENNEWKAFDIDGKRRGISEFHLKEMEVADWEEIEDRIDAI